MTASTSPPSEDGPACRVPPTCRARSLSEDTPVPGRHADSVCAEPAGASSRTRARRTPDSAPSSTTARGADECRTIQDHRIGYSVDFTNPATGTTWHAEGNPVSSFVFNPDGSVIQTVDGVWIAAGPLHTVYSGHWTRTFPDGVFGPVPFEGHGETVDICERMR